MITRPESVPSVNGHLPLRLVRDAFLGTARIDHPNIAVNGRKSGRDVPRSEGNLMPKTNEPWWKLFKKARRGGKARRSQAGLGLSFKKSPNFQHGAREPQPIKIGICSNDNCKYNNTSESALCAREDCKLLKEKE